MRLIRPDDPDYITIRRRYVGSAPDGPPEPQPVAVARCADTADVVAALAYAREHELSFVVRSGGHSYADHSSTAGLLIDVAGLRSLSVTDDDVTLGAGWRLGDVSDELTPLGRLIPSGSCPTVGLGGIALAGGFGWRGRRHGLTSDNIVRAEIVLADGSATTVDTEREPDLFWALRGAGAGNFGVVTALTVRTYPLTAVQAFYARWDWEHAVDVVDAWQRWAPDQSDGISAEVYLIVPDYDDEPAFAEFWGVSSDRPVLAEFVHTVGILPEAGKSYDLDPAAAARYLSGWMVRNNEPLWMPSSPHHPSGSEYVRSEFFTEPIPRSALVALTERMVADRAYGEYRDIEFTPWQGAYARPPADTAFVHRDARMLVSHTVLNGANATAKRRRGGHEWVTDSRRILAPHGNGHVYQGYPEPELDGWGHAYYGSALPRLAAVKETYDPMGFFAFDQSIR